MSWNKVIEDTKKEVGFRLRNHSHRETMERVIALEIRLIVNDDGTPIIWTIGSKNIKSNGNGAREVLKSLDIL